MALPSMTSEEAMRRAARLADQGKTDEARQLYEFVLRSIPTHKKARKALNALQRRAGGNLTEADFKRVDSLMRGPRLAQAHAEIQRLCAAHPNQPALHNLHGVVLSKLGRPQDALQAFNTALTLEPAFPDALNNLASTLTELERFPEALSCYQQIVQRGEADADVYANLARALRGEGRLEDAAAALNQAIALRPLYPDAYNSLGNICNEMGRHDIAIRAYEGALSVKPDHRNALLNLGRSMHTLGRYDRAQQAARKLLEIDSGDVAALRVLADTMRALGRRDDAAHCYGKIVALEPGDPVARHMLQALGTGEVARLGDPAYARAVFDAFATNFEQHVCKTLKYRVPESIPRQLERLDGENAWYPQALDLGCGTGLLGPQIRPYCEELLGVDISRAMLDRAAVKAVYDVLVEDDIAHYLRACEAKFDLLLCAEVLPYIGALEEFFAAIANCCSPRARFIVTSEQLGDGDMQLRDTGRYAHSASYVQRCARDARLQLLQHENISLGQTQDTSLEGALFVFTPEPSASEPSI